MLIEGRSQNNITGLMTINQTSDSAGLEINGYDDQSSKFIKTYINASGYTYIEASSQLNLKSNTTTVSIESGTNQDMNFDCGNYFNFRDRDAGYSGRVTINSATGDIDTIGDISADGDIYIGADRVITSRQINSSFVYSANTGDSNTDSLINAIKSALIAHGLISVPS